MTGALMAVATNDFVTVNTNWGSKTAVSPNSGNTGTLSTTPGVSLTITMTFTLTGAGPVKYKLNAGAFTSFTSGTTRAVTNGDTLQFQLTGASSDNTFITVKDPAGLTVGTQSLTIT